MDLVLLILSFKVTPTAQKGKVLRTLDPEKWKIQVLPGGRHQFPWRYKTMGHEVHNGAELPGRTRGAQRATRTGWVREVSLEEGSWRETFAHRTSWVQSAGRERSGRERAEGSRDLDKRTEVRMVTAWLWGRQCMLGVIGNRWSQMKRVGPACGSLSTLGRIVQTGDSWVYSTGIIWWEQGLRKISRKLPWEIPSVRGPMG